MREHGVPIPHLSHGQVTLEHCRFINGIMCTNSNFQVMTKELTPETEIPWWRIPKSVKIRVIVRDQKGSAEGYCSFRVPWMICVNRQFMRHCTDREDSKRPAMMSRWVLYFKPSGL